MFDTCKVVLDRASRVKYSSLFVSIFAALSLVHISFIGRLMASELFALFFLLVLFFLNRLPKIDFFYSVALGYLLLLLGLVVSDIYNQSFYLDFLRGWASVIFGLISIWFLTAQFVKSYGAIYSYLMVLAFFTFFINNHDHILVQNIAENSNYFKIRYAPIFFPVIALCSILIWERRKILSAVFLFMCGVTFITLDARSAGLVLVVSSALSFAQAIKLNINFKRMLIAGIGSLAVLYSGYIYYVDLVIERGAFGSNAKQLNLSENPYNLFDLILIARSENLVSIEAIKDKPILGFGSWAKDTSGKYERIMASLKQKEDYKIPLGVIPKHSILLGAWVWGGLIAMLGVLWIAYTMLRLFLMNFMRNDSLSPMINMYYVASVWALFFSPIGHVRTSYPFTIALLIAAAHIAKNRKKLYS